MRRGSAQARGTSLPKMTSLQLWYDEVMSSKPKQALCVALATTCTFLFLLSLRRGALTSKLNTHHDNKFVHKAFGLYAATHIFYRIATLYVNLMRSAVDMNSCFLTGNPGFREDDPADIALVAAHLILPITALLEFPIPVNIRKENIQRGFIFRQFVVHQLLFGARSLWFGPPCEAMCVEGIVSGRPDGVRLMCAGQPVLDVSVVFSVMLLAELAIQVYPTGTGTTIRTMAPTLSGNVLLRMANLVLKYTIPGIILHSTYFMLLALTCNPEGKAMPLLIGCDFFGMASAQVVAFLSTLKKKNILAANEAGIISYIVFQYITLTMKVKAMMELLNYDIDKFVYWNLLMVSCAALRFIMNNKWVALAAFLSLLYHRPAVEACMETMPLFTSLSWAKSEL
eukprot:scaffold2556_cov425-Prasinococcus_capsulatus_cf.AAC.14